MPRNLDRRPFELTSLSGDGDAAAQFTDRTGRNFPANQTLLVDISRALLKRLKRLSPNDAAFAYWRIRTIAAYENMSLLDEDEQAIGLDELEPRTSRQGLLNSLARGNLPRGAHWAPIVQVQRNRLMSYLETMVSDRMNDPYPTNPRTPASRQLWLRRHEKNLLRLLEFPCGCTYTATGKVRQHSLQAIINGNGVTSRSVRSCRTPGQLILRVISEWHGSGDQQIRRLLGKKFRR
jgi:hypothetical protein